MKVNYSNELRFSGGNSYRMFPLEERLPKLRTDMTHNIKHGM